MVTNSVIIVLSSPLLRSLRGQLGRPGGGGLGGLPGSGEGASRDLFLSGLLGGLWGPALLTASPPGPCPSGALSPRGACRSPACCLARAVFPGRSFLRPPLSAYRPGQAARGCYRQAPPTWLAQGPLAATNTLSRTRSLTVPRPPFDHLHPAAPSPWPQSQTLLVGATLQAASPWSACRPAWATQPPQVMRGPRAGGRATHIPRPPAMASRTPGPGAAGAGGGSGHPALSF